MRALLVLLVPLAVVLLSGCLGGGPSAAGGAHQATIPLSVLSAQVVPGRCFDGAQDFGQVCHALSVRFDNSAQADRMATDTLEWKAIDADGKVHDFGDSDADAVAGGATATLAVRFTLPDGASHLATLQYASFAGHGEAAVPAY